MITDGIAERRNLLVISLLFIAYFYGGGYIDGNTINFPMVNIKFQQTTYLSFMAYALFLWSIYRYWVKLKGKFKQSFYLEFKKTLDETNVFDELASSKSNLSTKKMLDGKPGTYFTIQTVTFKNEPKELELRLQLHNLTADGQVKHQQGNTKIELNCSRVKNLILFLKVKTAFNNPSFSEYIPPYIVAILGLFGSILAPAFHTAMAWLFS